MKPANQTNPILLANWHKIMIMLFLLSEGGTLSAQSCAPIILQNDTSVCLGSGIQLSSKEALSYHWFPANGLSNATGQNPVCVVDSSTTYYLTETSLSNNLVVNGDFENGNTGFISTYFYCNSYNCLFPLANNGYSVGQKAAFFHTLFTGTDHTTGSGNFMIINGADPSRTVWRETVNVTPNTTYAFGCWISTLIVRSTAQIRFSINGITLGPIYNAPGQTNLWDQFYIQWNSGANTTATIEIVDVLPVSDGNDFGLDDIFFGSVKTCTDSVHIDVLKTQRRFEHINLCSGGSYTLPSGKVISTPGNYIDTVKYLLGCDSLITNVSLTVSTVSINKINLSICGGEYYTLPSGAKASTSGLYLDTLRSSNGCDSIITLLNLSVTNTVRSQVDTTLCPGQKYLLPSGRVVSVTGTYADTLRSISGCDSLVLIVNVKSESVRKDNIDAVVCQGEPYVLPSGKLVVMGGQHLDTLRSVKGCDSVITMVNLVVNHVTYSNITRFFCSGKAYVLPSGRVVHLPGSYSDTLLNSNGCDSIVTIELRSYSPLSVALFGLSSVCKGDITSIRALASGGDSVFYSYEWSPSGDNISSIDFRPMSDTLVRVQVSDACGTYATDSMEIAVFAKPEAGFSFQPNMGCTQSAVHFINTTISREAGTYVWDFGDASGSTEISPLHKYYKAGLYRVSLVATNSQGCSDTVSASDPIIIFESPVASFNTSPAANLVINSPITFNNISDGAASWIWNFGDSSGISFDRVPVHKFNNEGSYLISLIAINDQHCSDTTYQKIVVYGKNSIFVPNVFTPNYDGRNDLFRPIIGGLPISLHFTVYNRWGEKVFETFQLHEGWNGIYHGNNSPVGTYVWICTYQFQGDRQRTRQGTFILLR